MKRGAKFLVLDQRSAANQDADYIILEIPQDEIRPLIRQLESLVSLGTRAGGGAVAFRPAASPRAWAVRLLVEASHPRGAPGSDGKLSHPPSLLKDSIPRAGRS
jgi:hypothetical protein